MFYAKILRTGQVHSIGALLIKRLALVGGFFVAVNLLIALLLPPAFALQTIASNTDLGCELAGAAGDVPSLGCLAIVVTNVIEVALMFLGAVALLFLLIGSAQLILARGDAKGLQKAKGTITFAIIGTVAVLLSFGVVKIITDHLGLPNILENFSFYQK